MNQRTKWAVIEKRYQVHVVPEIDSSPHFLINMYCPCRPRIALGDEKGMFERVLVEHTCFIDQQRIKEAVSKICV